MTDLIKIIRLFKPSEARIINQIFNSKSGEHITKRKKLFNLIYEKKCNTDKQARQYLNYTEAKSAYSHLKKRLKNDILNFILIFSDQETDDDNTAASEELKCYKLLYQGKYLLKKNLTDEAIPVLQKVFACADKYELPEIKIIAGQLLIKYKNQNRSNKNKPYPSGFNPLNELELLKEHLVANCYQQPEKTSHASFFKPETPLLFKKAQHNFVLQFSNLRSKKLKLHTYISFIQQQIQNHNFHHALELCNSKSLHDILKEPALRTKENLSLIRNEMAKTHIYLKNYDKAIDNATLAADIAGNIVPLQLLQSYNILFYASFYSNNLNQAFNICQKVLNQELYTNNNSLSHWNFYHATIAFAKREFKQSLKFLNAINKFNHEDIPLSLGIKIQELMNLVELHEHDWLECRIDCFRKYLKKFDQNTLLRFRSCYELFKTLTKNNFNISSTLSQQHNLLKKLESGQGIYYWDPLGNEPIRIEKWLCYKEPEYQT